VSEPGRVPVCVQTKIEDNGLWLRWRSFFPFAHVTEWRKCEIRDRQIEIVTGFDAEFWFVPKERIFSYELGNLKLGDITFFVLQRRCRGYHSVLGGKFVGCKNKECKDLPFCLASCHGCPWLSGSCFGTHYVLDDGDNVGCHNPHCKEEVFCVKSCPSCPHRIAVEPEWLAENACNSELLVFHNRKERCSKKLFTSRDCRTRIYVYPPLLKYPQPEWDCYSHPAQICSNTRVEFIGGKELLGFWCMGHLRVSGENEPKEGEKKMHCERAVHMELSFKESDLKGNPIQLKKVDTVQLNALAIPESVLSKDLFC
jgi:hypothetical protein